MSQSLAAATAASQDVLAALRAAERATGADFGYLLKVAEKESAFDAGAEAATSSAAGLFQFIEQTWLGAVKRYGAALGLDAAAADIAETDGRFEVADPARRAEILDLRKDPRAAARIAAAWTQENRAALEAAVGRPVDAGELYIAHFLGVSGARKLLTADGAARAADLFPAAARANRAIFFDGAQARTVAQTIEKLTRGFAEGAPAPAPRLAGRPADAPFVAPSFDANRVAGQKADARQTRAGLAALPGFAERALGPAALAALQALDPTKLKARRDD